MESRISDLEREAKRFTRRIDSLSDSIDGGLGGESLNHRLKVLRGQISNHRAEIHRLKYDIVQIKSILYILLFLQAIDLLRAVPWE